MPIAVFHVTKQSAEAHIPRNNKFSMFTLLQSFDMSKFSSEKANIGVMHRSPYSNILLVVSITLYPNEFIFLTTSEYAAQHTAAKRASMSPSGFNSSFFAIKHD